MADRPKALVTAPFRGEGMDTLQSVTDVIYDPWIEQSPIRLYDGEKLAARLTEEGADVLIVESDFVNGPVFDLPLKLIGSCRGDPNNVDVAAATKAGIPVLRAPGRNANAVAELTIGLLFAVNRFIVQGDMDVRTGQVYRDGKIPYQRYHVGALGPHRGHRRVGRRRARRQMALRRHRHERVVVRPVQPGRHPQRRPQRHARRV